MAPIDAMTIVLLCTFFVYSMALIYVLGMFLQPLLNTIVTGCIDPVRTASQGGAQQVIGCGCGCVEESRAGEAADRH